MSCSKCTKSLVKADPSFLKHFILFSLYHCPNLEPHFASGRCSHGYVCACDIAHCESRGRNRSAPKSRISYIYLLNQLIHPSFDFPTVWHWCHILNLPVSPCRRSHKPEGNQAHSFQLSRAYSQFGSAIPCSLGSSTEVIKFIKLLKQPH